MLREGAHDVKFNLIGLLEEIQARLGVSYLFIAHDLAARPHQPADRGDVFGQARRGGRQPRALCPTRSTLTPRPFSPSPFRRTPTRRKKRSSSVERCPAPSTRRQAAASTPAVPSSCRDARSESPTSSRCPQVIRSPATSMSLAAKLCSSGMILDRH
jgi:hypothetical protein